MLHGINLSGLEFTPGQQRPRVESVSYFVNKGMQIFRIPFMWELIQPKIGGGLDPTIVSYIKAVIAQIPSTATIILDCHNFGRYNGKIIGQDPSAPTVVDFGKLWYLVSTTFHGPNFIYGLINEPHDQEDGYLVAALESAIARIRSNPTQGWYNPILVPTNNWSNRWSDKDGIPAMFFNITDPANNLILDYHCYVDQYSSGQDTSIDPTSSPSWQQTIDNFIISCVAHKIYFIAGEFATGSDPTSLTALQQAMTKFNATPYCKGVCWWGGGGWAPTNYIYSLDPVGNAWDATTWSNPIDKPQMAYFLK